MVRSLAALGLTLAMAVALDLAPALALAATCPPATAGQAPAWERELRALDGHVHHLSLLNLVNGLNLTRDQATQLRRLALQVEAVSEAPPALGAPLPGALEDVRRAYAEVGRTLAKNAAVTPEAERRVATARAAHVRFIRSTLLAKPGGPDTQCSHCHADPAANARGAAQPMALTPEVARQAELAHCVADYGWLGLVALTRVSPQVEALLTEAQKEVFCDFSCCLIPPHDMGDPVRAGQADSTAKELDLLRKARSCPPDLWPAARSDVLRHLGPIVELVNPGATAERKAAACKAVGDAMDAARALTDTQFEIEKTRLARAVKEAIQPPAPDSPHKAAFFLLVPGSARVYTEYLKRLDAQEGAAARRP